MIDIETLGKTPDSVILSIGAAFFDLETGKVGETFYQPIFEDSQPFRSVSRSTIDWWNEQSDEARKVFFDENRKPLVDALLSLRKFMKTKNNVVWAQGPQFDIMILENAFDEESMNYPWEFWKIRDSRTVIQLASQYKFYGAKKGSHGALDDALTQIQNLCLAWKLIQGEERTT